MAKEISGLPKNVGNSPIFLRSVLDSVTEHIAVIDKSGNILFVNSSWVAFGRNNQCSLAEEWDDVNYLQACDKAAAAGDDFGIIAADGIRQVINSYKEQYYLEYPCHGPNTKRWFMMRVTPFSIEGNPCFVISHQNITERKLAEEKLLEVSRTDGLTCIANRRYFEIFLDNELRRASRTKNSVALAMVDIDHFKLLNDTYGHQAGDECLQKIGEILRAYTKRASDMCARYGGEEFAVVFGNSDLKEAKAVSEHILSDIRGLKIPNERAPTSVTVTASIGVASVCPSHQTDNRDLIKAADSCLYRAKENGRNQLVCAELTPSTPLIGL